MNILNKNLHNSNVNISSYETEGKTIPAEAWTDPEGSSSLRLPDFKTIGT
jgi:hypothetical protein